MCNCRKARLLCLLNFFPVGEKVLCVKIMVKGGGEKGDRRTAELQTCSNNLKRQHM